MTSKDERRYHIVMERNGGKSGRTFFGFDKKTLRPIFLYPNEIFTSRRRRYGIWDFPAFPGEMNAFDVCEIIHAAMRTHNMGVRIGHWVVPRII